jgi:hypothetical protein
MDLNTQDYRDTVKEIAARTALLTLDPLRESAAPMADTLMEFFSKYHKVVLPHEVSEIHDRV